MKVVMVLVIMLAVFHLAANFGGEADGGGGWERQRTRRSEIFDKKANGADRERRVGGESEPGKGEGGQVDVLERQIDEEKSDTSTQIDEEKEGDDTPQSDEEKGDKPQIGEENGDGAPLILLWNNYQGDKSALYNKIFHR